MLQKMCTTVKRFRREQKNQKKEENRTSILKKCKNCAFYRNKIWLFQNLIVNLQQKLKHRYDSGIKNKECSLV